MTELVDPSVYRVSFFIRRIRAHQVVQLFHACTESAALIDVERHQNLIPRLHLFRHLFIWKKQILFQSPVQEGTEFANLRYLQDCTFPQCKLRFIYRCDQTVRRILIQKHLNRIARFDSCRNLLLRKKNLFSVISQIYSEINYLYYRKHLFFS